MSTYQCISIAQAKELMSKPDCVVVDIRDPNSFAQGHIEGSHHLSNQNITELTSQWEFEQAIIVVCYHGHSSQQAAQYLTNLGFEHVYSMDGGYSAWHLQNLV